MKELYGEGPASHTDPESCVVSRKAGHDALKGHMQAEHRAAKYLEIFLREPDARHAPVRFGIRMPTCLIAGQATRVARHRERPLDLRGQDLRHAWNLHAREPGDPNNARHEVRTRRYLPGEN